MIMLFGVGIPGVFTVGDLLGLESVHVRDRFTFWVYWLMVGLCIVAACFAIACRFSLQLPTRKRLTEALFAGCLICIILDLACSTILCTLSLSG